MLISFRIFLWVIEYEKIVDSYCCFNYYLLKELKLNDFKICINMKILFNNKFSKLFGYIIKISKSSFVEPLYGEHL